MLFAQGSACSIFMSRRESLMVIPPDCSTGEMRSTSGIGGTPSVKRSARLERSIVLLPCTDNYAQQGVPIRQIAENWYSYRSRDRTM